MARRKLILETDRAATDEITPVPLGPLSTIAPVLALDPKFVDRVPEIIMMADTR